MRKSKALFLYFEFHIDLSTCIAYVLSNAFYSRPSDPPWNPNADVNADDAVKNMGQICA